MRKISTLFLSLGLLLLIISCGKNSNRETFDREGMLINYSENIISPQLDRFQKDIESLDYVIADFGNTPTMEDLISAREAYKTAILQWEKINYLNFGPGAREGLKLSIAEEFALFPVDEIIIESKIAENNFLLDDGRRYTRGLLSIDYLLYSKEGADSTLTTFDETRTDYIQAISDKLKVQVDDFVADWKEYEPTFRAAVGTDLQGSTTLLYNEWVRSYELLKNMKLVEPMGLKAGSLGPNTDLVESRFASLSLELAEAHFENMVDVYLGGSGLGIDDYVRSVDGGEEQVRATLVQIDKIRDLFDSLPAGKTLQDLIEGNATELDLLQKEMQVLLPKFKSEISSLLGLTITYSTGDGD